MITITPKCDTYESDVKLARNLIRFYKVLAFLPAVFLFVLGIVLAFVEAVCLIISAVGILYLALSLPLFSAWFKKINDRAVKKFMEYYEPSSVNVSAKLLEDNKDFTSTIGSGNPLICWVGISQLNYITAKMPFLSTLKLRKTPLGTYDAYVHSDFGCLCIPLDNIDHYRDGSLVCKAGYDVYKFKFEDEKAFDRFIPQKEFYFAAEKKGETGFNSPRF